MRKKFIKINLIKYGEEDTVYVLPEIRDYFVKKAKENDCPILNEEEVYLMDEE